MSKNPTSASETVAILIGATEWPDLGISGGDSFRNSFSDFKSYLCHPRGLALADRDILEIFDSLDSPATITVRIIDFLQGFVASSNAPDRNVILYLLWQGQLWEGQFYFALRQSKRNQYPTTFLSAAGITSLLTEEARSCRHFVIVDACHAAAIEHSKWNSPKGACVLSSSRATDLSQARSSRGSSSDIRTQFTGAMLDVLSGLDQPSATGTTQPELLSFETLKDRIWTRTKELHGQAAVLPELRTVSGRPTIQATPLFPVVASDKIIPCQVNRPPNRLPWVLMAVVAMLAVIGSFVFALSFKSPPPHQVLTQNALQSLELADEARLEGRPGELSELYGKSIRYARECVDKFGGEAEQIQQQHESERIELPPIAGVIDKARRETIGKRGVLNDVATCWWVIGQSEHHLGHKEKSLAAYYSLSRLTYARCFTADGTSIWSPPNKADSYLNQAQNADSNRAP